MKTERYIEIAVCLGVVILTILAFSKVLKGPIEPVEVHPNQLPENIKIKTPLPQPCEAFLRDNPHACDKG